MIPSATAFPTESQSDSYYVLLEVPRSATSDEIDCAYACIQRELGSRVRRWLLLTIYGCTEKDFEEAYRVLRDPELRAAYDRSLQQRQAPPIVPPPCI